MLTDPIKNYHSLKDEAIRLGVRLFGVADITGIRQEIKLAQDLPDGFKRAVCLGISLSKAILDTIGDCPNKIYFHHYRSANVFLDQVSFRLANFIQSKGFQALPIAASQIIDWQKQTAHISHKKIGYLAGLGWIGRNNLLVTKEFGSQFRLTSILTDMTLRANKPKIEEDCGQCRSCIEACPVDAIGEKTDDFSHQKCFEKLQSFQKSGLVGQYICGVCVKACKGGALGI
ncbi:MAG: 4Fe-4S binding protein [Candidatus Omnitrophica bacterium]|nr:4Fe-4S binding protein [Candidatus Omnitrophota bacterium]